VQKAVFVMNQA